MVQGAAEAEAVEGLAAQRVVVDWTARTRRNCLRASADPVADFAAHGLYPLLDARLRVRCRVRGVDKTRKTALGFSNQRTSQPIGADIVGAPANPPLHAINRRGWG